MSEVSVVIPTYNRASVVTRALDSVLRQTFPVTEILVVDDGSSDDTRQRVAPYLGKPGPPVRYILQENRGVAAARNEGTRQAKSALIAFLDSDDVWEPEKIEKQLPGFSDSRVGLVYSDLKIISPSGEVLGSFIEGKGALSGDAFAAMLRHCFILASTAIIRRSCLEEIGGFDETVRLAEDQDFWLKLCRRHHVKLIDEPLALYVRQKDSMTRNTVGMSEWLITIYRKWLPRELGLRPEERAIVRKMIGIYHLNLAVAIRDQTRGPALIHALQSIRYNPRNPLAWKCLFGTLRRLFGRPRGPAT